MKEDPEPKGKQKIGAVLLPRARQKVTLLPKSDKHGKETKIKKKDDKEDKSRKDAVNEALRKIKETLREIRSDDEDDKEKHRDKNNKRSRSRSKIEEHVCEGKRAEKGGRKIPRSGDGKKESKQREDAYPTTTKNTSTQAGREERGD
jgi:hypothetical protein